MLASYIGWILVASGFVTAGAGSASLLFPHLFSWIAFGVHCEPSSEFFVRHWGLLIFLIGTLIVYSAYVPAVRTPVLAAAAIEKFAIGLLIFLAPMKRTSAMTAIAIGDGIFAILYVAYLGGL
jgi:hypothetical protein